MSFMLPPQARTALHLRAFLAAAVLPLLMLAPGAAWAGLFNPESFTLDNGMQVVVIPDHRAPVVHHMVWYKVGAADEQPGKSGLAHLTEHLMFKGTPTVPDGDFSKLVRRAGGQDNAFTSSDYTGYFQTIAADRLPMVMEMEADRMANLDYAEEDFAPELKVVLEERSSRTDNNPQSLLSEQMDAAQYQNHPYGRPVIGWRHEIEGLTRADAVAFYRRHYAPNNAILVVAGDIDAARLKPLAEATYGRIPAREVAPRMRPQEPPQLAPRRLTLTDRRVQRPAFSRTYLAPTMTAGESRHAVPLTVLSEILGGGASGRLYDALVRQAGTAVYAGSWYDEGARDLGTFSVYAAPAPDVELAKVEAEVDAEIARILADGVTAEELARAKTVLLAEAVYARDSLGQAARVFGQGLTAGQSIAQIEAWPDDVRAVTAADVQEAARAVLQPERSVTGWLQAPAEPPARPAGQPKKES
ncbi:MAG: pitrilysin family protein [Sneathiellaceae bacterium]